VWDLTLGNLKSGGGGASDLSSVDFRIVFLPARTTVYGEADFYYEREGLPGICVFCDGPDHDQPNREESDQRERGKLGDLGYRILTIRYDSKMDEQLISNQDVFGAGVKPQGT
jgi:hypothetical protein